MIFKTPRMWVEVGGERGDITFRDGNGQALLRSTSRALLAATVAGAGAESIQVRQGAKMIHVMVGDEQVGHLRVRNLHRHIVGFSSLAHIEHECVAIAELNVDALISLSPSNIAVA